MDAPSAAERWPPATQARIAGVCYLVVIAAGIFAELGVRERLFVSGDPAATAGAIRTNEALWRWGIALHLLYLIPATAAGVILYRLFRHVHATLALLALVLLVCAVAIEGLLVSSLHFPLTLATEAGQLGALEGAQRDALSYLAVRSFFVGWSFALLIFAGFCVLIGVLIVRSHLIPRVLGVLMIAAGAGYVANTLAGILAPPVAARMLPWVLLPAFVGELSLALWLAVKGVRMAGGDAAPHQAPDPMSFPRHPR